jgi:hypothetical protein
MITTFQLITVPLCIIFGIYAMIRRKNVLSRRQSVFWVFLWLTAALAIALPNIASALANLVGIGRGADLVLYVMTFACFLLVRYFYLRQRRLEILITELVRREALSAAGNSAARS